MLDDVFGDFDVLLVPSAPGEAPHGLKSTGEATFNRMWTALHVPAVTVPAFTGPAGLPIGAQLIESNVVARAKRVASVVHATVLS